MREIHALKSGGTVELSDGDVGPVRVSYHDRPSTGDNGKRVAGATVGGYVVEYPNGRTQSFDHGPHANTDGARKKGANPNAKQWAAEQASKAAITHLRTAKMGFNDRR